MLFPTLNFGLFFIVVFAASWLLHRWGFVRKTGLVAASYFFYGWWDWRFMGLLFASSLWNYGAGRLLAATPEPRRRALICGVAIAVDLGVLGIFKYYNFFLESLSALLSGLGIARDLPFLSIIVPVGVSFFTFHGISYLVDIKRGQLKVPAGLVDMMLYISFFPQLVAGPIVRASHFLPQIAQPVDPNDIRATRAYLLIIGGLLKKVVVANYLATDLVDDAFFDPTRYGGLDLLLATYGYALQIYCDFSAYTDIAIGVAALFGYRFPQNFNQPYRAAGMRDFWRRWHISLSSWLRDYLYISLGGNSGGWKRYRNLMLTMLLGGLWHGAAWNFVIWGAAHGTALAAEHRVFEGRKTVGGMAGRIVAVVLTFHFVCLTWIFFRSPDLDRALLFLGGFARPGTLTLLTPFIAVLVAASFAAQFLPVDRIARLERVFAVLPLPLQGAVLGFAILAIDSFGPSGVAPFIYFQF